MIRTLLTSRQPPCHLSTSSLKEQGGRTTIAISDDLHLSVRPPLSIYSSISLCQSVNLHLIRPDVTNSKVSVLAIYHVIKTAAHCCLFVCFCLYLFRTFSSSLVTAVQAIRTKSHTQQSPRGPPDTPS